MSSLWRFSAAVVHVAASGGDDNQMEVAVAAIVLWGSSRAATAIVAAGGEWRSLLRAEVTGLKERRSRRCHRWGRCLSWSVVVEEGWGEWTRRLR